MIGYMNQNQTAALFEQEAILFGSREGIPDERAAAIFGQDAVDFAIRQGQPGETHSGYGIGDYTAWYLTRRGVFIAATYSNVKLLREQHGAENGQAAGMR